MGNCANEKRSISIICDISCVCAWPIYYVRIKRRMTAMANLSSSLAKTHLQQAGIFQEQQIIQS